MDDLLKGSGCECLLEGDGKPTHRENVLKRYNLADKSYSLKQLATISKVPIEILQEVYNRGIGAARTQPTSIRLKGSYVKNVKAPKSSKLSDEQWAYARIYSFLDGNPAHDNDLRRNEKKVGGIAKNVAFIRKAMAKTKLMNKGYKPPAQWGYDFPLAMEIDKPSKHIQTNIGRVPATKVKKFNYKRVKKSALTDEERKRNEVMKPEYWGLSFDDFEEVDGELVEKKHGLLWRPIYFKPTDKEEGCWGLRCCRYDKDGNTIPSNKKYEWIYFRDEDDCGDVPSIAEKDIPTEADPPDEVDNDGVKLERYFAKAKKNKMNFMFGRKRRPFFWADLENEDSKKKVLPPLRKPTYKDIPVIISANREMVGYIHTFQNSRNQYIGEPYFVIQQERWASHLEGIERTDDPEEKLQQHIAKNKRGRKPTAEGKIGKKHVARTSDGDKVEFQQQGRYKNPETGNKWGKARAEKYLKVLEDRQDANYERAKRYARAIGANQLLINALIEDPMGEDLDYNSMIEEAEEVGFGNGLDVVQLRKAYEGKAEYPKPEPIEDAYERLEYDKGDAKRLMDEARANLSA